MDQVAIYIIDNNPIVQTKKLKQQLSIYNNNVKCIVSLSEIDDTYDHNFIIRNDSIINYHNEIVNSILHFVEDCQYDIVYLGGYLDTCHLYDHIDKIEIYSQPFDLYETYKPHDYQMLYLAGNVANDITSHDDILAMIKNGTGAGTLYPSLASFDFVHNIRNNDDYKKIHRCQIPNFVIPIDKVSHGGGTIFILFILLIVIFFIIFAILYYKYWPRK